MNIFTKFHKDWTTIVDFLLIAKFWASPDNYYSPSSQIGNLKDFKWRFCGTPERCEVVCNNGGGNDVSCTITTVLVRNKGASRLSELYHGLRTPRKVLFFPKFSCWFLKALVVKNSVLHDFGFGKVSPAKQLQLHQESFVNLRHFSKTEVVQNTVLNH